MSTNKALAESIQNYLSSNGGILEKTFPNMINIWSFKGREISLPTDVQIGHRQSKGMLFDAVSVLANINELSHAEMELQLVELDSDFLSVRASGEAIQHGKIKYKQGLDSLAGLYDVIKLSANKSVGIKGKRRVVQQYLDSVNMLTPEAGSFIYRVEMGLIHIDDESDCGRMDCVGSIGRYINSQLAFLIQNALSVMNSMDAPSPAKLMRAGINITFCDSFLKLFPRNSEQLDFRFNWSRAEDVDESLPRRITFKLHDRDTVAGYRALLKQSKVIPYKDIPAIIEAYSWPENSEVGKVTFRVSIDGAEHTCSYKTENERYMALKEQEPKKKVKISGDFVITTGAVTKIEILKLDKIDLVDRTSAFIEQLEF